MSDAATTETRTEYGIKYPDGSIDWRTELHGIDLTSIVTNKRLNTMHGSMSAIEATLDKLAAKAELLHIDPAEFIAGHSIVTRQIITITMGHDVIVKLESPKKTDLNDQF